MSIEIWSYWLFAFVQAVVTVRVLEVKEAPVFAVVAFVIFAPVITLGWIAAVLYVAIYFLATYKAGD